MTLPLDIVAADTALARVHRAADDPVFFGPGAGAPPTYRFDSLTGSFGVLYVGARLPGALVETLLRNPKRRMVAYHDVALRASSELRCPRDLRLVDLHGAGLQQLGLDNAISTGPYGACGAWAEALWSHPEAPDGIAYQSRHDPREICLAIFERPGLRFVAAPAVALLDQLPDLATILSGYGKSIAGPPR
jgi:hypothetical protein